MSHNADPNCIFCKIVAGTLPCFKVAETEHTLAFLDINPLSHGHTLVIPKYHAQKVHEVPVEAMAELGKQLVVLSKAIGAADYNILQNNGRNAHQLVDHAHFHIIPKTEDEGLKIGWPCQAANKEVLAQLCKDIKQKL